MTVNKESDKFENEFEIPDGGWGWMVAIGLTVICVNNQCMKILNVLITVYLN